MARPNKTGLDYFPMDVHNDDKLELIEAEFGLIGWAIIFKLFGRIYKNGYYTKWGDDEKLLFSRSINVDINTINSVINKAIEREIFDIKLYEKYEILTSRGIQKRYIEGVRKRLYVEMFDEFMLVNIDNTNINLINYANNQINGGINSHIKLKEIKPKKKKENESKEKPDKSDLPPFSISLSELVFNHAGVNPTKKQIQGGAEVINDINRLDGYKPDEIKQTIEWALDDEFWKRNVQSPASLRKKKNGAGDFTKFQKIYNQWKNKPLTDAEIAQQTIDRLNERERLKNEGKDE